MKNIFKKTAALVLGAVSVVCAGFGLAGCKNKSTPVSAPESVTTVRYALPNDGSLPTAHTALENVGYLAYVLDNQGFYHAYAHNSSKSMGYEQITQTWKDYKSETLSGQEGGVMICSDLTYSTFVKAGTQSCFTGGEVYMRTSEKPGKTTNATSAVWSQAQPTYYDKESYLYKYGEFSTELSVYVINEDTVTGAGEVVVNEDGTYSVTLTLNEEAGCYYQYGMKTRGGLKGYPEFKSIVITFTFDGNWQILSSYCEEKAKISPGALGGITIESTSKTTTTFYYDSENFDDEHYGYFDSYYKNYLGTKLTPGEVADEPELLDVLGGGFSSVVDPSGSGQQFNVALTVGQTDYEGKIFLAIPDLAGISDAVGSLDLSDLSGITGLLNGLSSLDLRMSLGLAGSGNQDLYIGFEYPSLKAYYSEDFALSANLVSVVTYVSKFSDWLTRFDAPAENVKSTAAQTAADGTETDPLTDLLNSFRFTYTDTAAYITLATDDLLGTGIGADVSLSFSRIKGEDGSTYEFVNAAIKSIKYSGNSIDLSLEITPDSGAKITRDPSSTPELLTDYLANVYGLLNSNTVAVNIVLDGDGEDVISYLKGIKANITSNVELGNNMAAKVDLQLEYEGIAVDLSAYYSVDIYAGDYGVVYLTLNSVNGIAVGANVYCDISDTAEALTSLLTEIGVLTDGSDETPDNSTDGTDNTDGGQTSAADAQAKAVAETVNKVLNLNFAEILGEVYAKNSEIRLSVNIDSLLSQLGIEVCDLQFGTAALALAQSGKQLNLSLPALGLTVTATGSTVQLVVPDGNAYLDATELINLVRKAVPEAQAIIDNEALTFDIDAVVTPDGTYENGERVSLGVIGKGEVDWSNKTVAEGEESVTTLLRLALDVTLFIQDGTSQSAKDSVALKLIYDETAGEDEPLVRLAVNGLGLDIYRSDISGVQESLDKIISSINTLLGSSSEELENANDPDLVVQTLSGEDAQVSSSGDELKDILTVENLQKIIGVVFNAANKFTANLGNTNVDGEGVNALIIGYASNGTFTLGVDNNLSLSIDLVNDYGNQIAEGSLKVAASSGFALGSTLNTAFGSEDYTFYSTAEAAETFTSLVYRYLFAVIDDISIENVLGSNTYQITLSLNGADSGISALNGVTVNAELYYTQGVIGDKLGNKLMEADLDLDINGTAVVLNARYSGQYIYITLSKVGTTTLSGIKVMANVNDIYSAAEELVALITNENFPEIVRKIFGAFSTDNGEELTAVALTDDDGADGETSETAQSALADVIAKILDINVGDLLSYNNIGGEKVTASVNIDNVLALLGSEMSIGTVSVSVENRVINANISRNVAGADGSTSVVWASLTVQKVAKRDYSVTETNDWTAEYIDISFLSNLLADFNNTLTDDNGNIYTLYTFSGSANIHLNVSFKVIITYNIDVDVPLDITTLTAGLDEDGDFYFSLIANLQDVTKAGFTITQAGTVCVSYSKGYITFGRELGTESEKYKVMTLAYLLDNMFAEHDGDVDSPVRWMLGTSDTIWNYGIAPNINMSSGLTNPQSYYLYNELAQASDDGIFRLAALLNGFAADVNGETLSTYGNGTYAAEALGLYSNYYAFDVNANALTDGLIKTLYAALYRSDDQGISGLKATGSLVASPATITFSLDLNKYLEGVTQTSVTDIGNCAAPNLLKTVTENYTVDFTDPSATQLFGCYSTETGTYEYSNLLERVTLTIVGLNGEVMEEVELTTGSTVYLTNVFSPVWANDEHTAKIYYTDNGVDLGAEMVLNSDTTIYAATSPVTEVYFTIGKGGINGVSGAVGEKEALSEYALNGYAFLGWYNDEDFTSPATNLSTITNVVNGVKTVYGWYVRTEVTAANGVIYTFDADKKEYAVTGYNEFDIADYTESGSVLVLENEIDGYKVTSIAANAFAGVGLKNVIIPENITSVGAQAFMDNYGIETVVFLADSVYLAGTTSAKTTVFYGCSTADGTSQTNIKVYYNAITAEAGDNWGYFRDGENYIGRNGNGSAYAGGTWSYVEFTVAGNISSLNCLVSGLKTDNMTADQIKSAVIAELNGNTQSDGYINAYAVEVSSGYTANGKLNNITVTITTATPYYQVTVESEITGSIVSGTAVEIFNGRTYAKAGTEVNIAPPDTYKFSLLTGDIDLTLCEDGSYSFTMPDTVLTFNATCEYEGVTMVTLNSAVAWSYDGTEYGAGESCSFSVVEGETVLSEPTASGYIFLGWAYNNGGVLEFTTSTVQYSTYYAIWAVARDEISSIDILTSGTNPNAATVYVDTGKANSFYGWYTDNAFETPVSEIVAGGNTVLYARLNFTLTVSLQGSSGSNSYFYASNAYTDTSGKSSYTGSSYTDTIIVLENDVVVIDLQDSSTQIIVTYAGNDTWYRAKKVGTLGLVSTSRTFTLSVTGTVTVTGNMTLTAAF